MTTLPDPSGAAPTPVSPPLEGPAGVLYGLNAPLPEGVRLSGSYPLRGLMVAFFLFIPLVLRMLGVSLMTVFIPWQFEAAIPVVLILAAVGSVIAGKIRARRFVGEIPKELPESAGRLRAAGKRTHLMLLKKLPEPRDEAFEPIILFTPRVVRMPKLATAVLVVTTIAMIGLIELLQWSMHLPLQQSWWLMVTTGIAAGMGMQILFWPTYIRIAPGRLDVMRFRLGGGKPQVTTLDLRGAQVLAQFNRGSLLVKPLGGTEWMVFDLRGVWNPAVLVHAVLRGAVSTAVTPPMAGDRFGE